MAAPNSASPSGGGEPHSLFALRCALKLTVADACRALGVDVERWYGMTYNAVSYDHAEAERRLRAYAAARTARPDGETP